METVQHDHAQAMMAQELFIKLLARKQDLHFEHESFSPSYL